MLDEYIEPPQNDVRNLIAENDYLNAVGQIVIKNKNGGSIKYAYCDVWRFRNGKMAELIAFVVESDDFN